MLLKKLKDVVDVDLSTKLKVTDETVEALREQARRGCRFGDDSVRIAMGRVMTDKEMEERRKRDYLPGESFYYVLAEKFRRAYSSLADLLRRLR